MIYLQNNMEKNTFDKQGAFDHIMKTLQDLSNLVIEMTRDYVNIVDSLNKERREMFKYVGTIAGAAAALSPQIFINVKNINHEYFFMGVSFLIVVLIVSMLYVIASVENSGVDEVKAFKEHKDKIKKLKNIANIFLLSTRNESEYVEYVNSLSAINDELQVEEEGRQNKEKRNKDKFYQGLDYASEFVLLFFVCGITLLILSIINISIKFSLLIYFGILIFVLINIMSSFQRKIFVYLGYPIDLVKGCARLLLKTKK